MRTLTPQTALDVWQRIHHKERWGIPLTPEEREMLFEPRTAEHVLAELAASRYGFLV